MPFAYEKYIADFALAKCSWCFSLVYMTSSVKTDFGRGCRGKKLYVSDTRGCTKCQSKAALSNMLSSAPRSFILLFLHL